MNAQDKTGRFSDRITVLVATAAQIGHYRRTGARADFIRALEGMGMPTAEAEGYWEAVTPSRSTDTSFPVLTGVHNNTQLAARLGLELGGQRFPRNLLLYRLLECAFPELFKVVVTGSEHVGGKASRRNPSRRIVRFVRQPTRLQAKNGRRSSLCTMPIYQIYQGIRPSEVS